jgi:hypothetical protein
MCPKRLLGRQLHGKLPGLALRPYHVPMRHSLLLTRCPARWPRLRAALLPLAVAASLAACSNDDPFRSSATVESVITSVSMAGFSTGTVAPSALDLVTAQLVRPELAGTGSANFQLALDVDASGQVSLLPLLALLTPPSGGISVGLQRATADFDALTRAPNAGYATDSIVTTQVGESWFFSVQSGLCTFGDPFYGKLEIEGVNTETRRIFLRFLINRNCGYRDLTVGVPNN